MDYLTFDLRIGASDRRVYPVSVIQSPAGEASAPLQLHSDDPVFQRSLQTLENVRGTSRGTRQLGAIEDNNASAATGVSELKTAQEVGTILFEALFTSTVLSCYRISLAAAREQGKRLRLRLRVEAPELAGLPWEFLYDDAEGDHITLLRETPLTRYLEMGRPAETLTIQPPIRILGMIASPNDLPTLDTERERRWMVEAIDHLIESRQVELVWVAGQTWRDLNRAMQAGEWHIFHFIGHGGFDPALGEGRIALVDEASGGSNFLSATQLGRLFAAHPSLRLAVINACEGARASEHSIFSSTGAVLARRGIPAVVSMQYAITDRASIEFSRSFYDGLARGLPVDGAVQEARLAISMALGNSTEWGTPVLYMRTPDGALFHVDLSSAIFQRPVGAPPTTTPPAPAPEPAGQDRPTRLATAPAGENRRGLEILLRKVRQYWIDGVLDKSLFQAILINLGLQHMQDAVRSPWGETPWTGQLERPGAESQPLAPQQKIADVFEEEGGSLLILGEPGSGKTISMLQLTRSLLDRAESDPLRPVPVVFNLSTWTAPYTTLDAWLVDELSASYQIPRKIGQGWLAESRLFPLLDGLDELEVQRRAECVEAINRFTEAAGLVGAVVCCRLQEYIDLPTRLSLNAAVRLLPLGDDQVQSYLVAAGERLAGLRDLLQRDSAMRIEARSPLMLSLMSRAYQDVPVDQLLHEGGVNAAARRKQLMDAFVAQMFRRAAQGRGG